MKQTNKKPLSSPLPKPKKDQPIVHVSHHHHHTSIQDVHWESFGYGALSVFGIIAVFFFLSQGVTVDALKGSLDQAQTQKIERIERQIAQPVEALITPESVVGNESEYIFILDDDGGVESIVPALSDESGNDLDGKVLGASDQKQSINDGSTTKMNLMIR